MEVAAANRSAAIDERPEQHWEHAYPGTTDQVRRVRAALRDYLGDCPVADDTIHRKHSRRQAACFSYA
jgi:hypothetical protein